LKYYLDSPKIGSWGKQNILQACLFFFLLAA
jgi:hypothetical protein